MVKQLTNIFSLTGNGLRDWMVQRITSVILVAYIFCLFGFLLFNSGFTYFDWQALFANPWFRIFSLITLLSIMLHAWLGIWTVLTDYIKPTWLRVVLHVAVIIALLAYLIWGVEILWGI
jgi:succinate dehydrogenase / fumarate reductase, membrane anchor subunit